MPRESYQRRLAALRDRVVEMADLVVQRLRLALETLESGDRRLAREVVEGDHEINELYLDLESECIDLFALEQPVAGDLRFVAASFKIITDLERIGDLATNLAAYAAEVGGGVYAEVDVRRIGALTAEMVEDAIDAFDRGDAAACFEIDRRDDEVDTHCEQAGEVVVRDLITREHGDLSESRVEAIMDEVSLVLLMIRDLERVGDHAVNIAARTLYMEENDDELLY
ncbi:phosphate signaling complex protein PhoU [Natronomonas salina]|uniref:phosphate signaling complex protein PhoU n=1 Tax=Natronomonas salina TaxID=1710540 RepID=UPI0015B42B7E|nr:phosphate signaling complex protein PhoU [Natronomonas salina]QLD89984.1 phosphate signaling complex protein PhoU [Natronomonas salina]